jgi:hypothetical protein
MNEEYCSLEKEQISIKEKVYNLSIDKLKQQKYN